MNEDRVSQTDRSSHASHGGQSVNIVFSASWKVAAILAALMFGLALFTQHTANQANLKAGAAIKTADYSANEFRMTQFWLQRASLACQRGEPLPIVPANLLK